MPASDIFDEATSKKVPDTVRMVDTRHKMAASDEELNTRIQRAQEGDVRAFEALVREYLPRIRRYALAFAVSHDAADELAQEALVKVFKNIRFFRFQASFSTWLYAVVRHAFIDASRSRSSHEKALEEPLSEAQLEALAAQDAADEALVKEQEKRRLWAAIRQLAPEFRTVIVLFDIEGLSYDEVASSEQVPVGTVKSRLSRARRQLAQILSTAEGTHELPLSSHKKVTHT